LPDQPSPAPDIVILAEPADAGQRLDKFLAGRIGTMSRSRVKGLLLEGAVTRDGIRVADPADEVTAGAVYRVSPPAVAAAFPVGQDIPFPIFYEDKYLLVLNQDGTLVNALIAHCGDSLTGIGGERRPGIVHRLDKDTSGVMVVAKTELALTRLSAAFAARDIEREYNAICWGVLNPTAGAIKGDIGRDPRDRKRMAVVTRNGKTALTNYRIICNFGTAASQLACRLATGRTHQIRVHLASIGHPLIGDPVYLKRRPAAAQSLAEPARGRALDFPRQALHAETLGFSHPITGATLRFVSPPPDDFQQLIHALKTGLI
jgi:23S rRNA pseudouridine1911/1915/1917 synthase